MRNNLKYSFAFLFFLISAPSFSQTWKWEKKAGGKGNDYGDGLALDKKSNVYITGLFVDTISIGTTTLTSAGGEDIFIAKYDSSGNFLWAKRAGGTADDYGNALCVDDSFNVYVVGAVGGNAAFDSDSLTGLGGYDGYLAKYDSTGKCLWVRHIGGAGSDGLAPVAIDKNGDVIIGGTFTGTALFDTIKATGKGQYDAFIAKYTPNGRIKWLRVGGGAGQDYVFGLTIDPANNILCDGIFMGTANFGPFTITGAGFNQNTFIIKYASNGNITWIRQAGGNGLTAGMNIASDLMGNCYVAGYFNNSTTFDTTTLISAGKEDAFIAKYDDRGNRKWVKRMGGTGYDYSFAIATDLLANSYITGYIDKYLYVSKYDSSGNGLWLKKGGGSGQLNSGYALAVDVRDYLYLTGLFSSVIPFDTDTLKTSGGWDIFVAKEYVSVYPEMISEPSLIEHMTVFPNPTTGQLFIHLQQGMLKKANIYNPQGKLVRSLGDWKGQGDAVIDLSEEKEGIYLLEVETIDGKIIKKIVRY
ncbi:MAG TPA: SBBP repeat-containing protein [Bacteroidia bacterium]|jgi:hypothetical protein|nr:SBBP repeat-containing protein [Bacteroidia bacterium]